MKKLQDYIKNRYLWIRIAIILFIIVLAIVLFLIGKQHQFLLDNNTKEANGTTYSALSIVEAQIDKNDILEIPRRTRLSTYATGQIHTLTVTYSKNGEEITKSERFRIPVRENIILISIPAFVNDASKEDWMEEFLIQINQDSDEDGDVDDMSLDISF